MTSKPFVAQFGLQSGNNYLRSVSGKAVVNSSSDPTFNFEIKGTEGVLIPIGNTVQRPVDTIGVIRYNSETGRFEGFSAAGWGGLGGNDTGADVTNAYVQATFLRLDGGTLTGNILPTANQQRIGNPIARWSMFANTGDFSGALTIRTGVYPFSNTVGASLGANDLRFNLFANAIVTTGNIAPVGNASFLGAADARFNMHGNVVTVSGSIVPVSNTVGASLGNTTALFNIFANTLSITGSFSPSSNSVGTELGTVTQRWNFIGNTISISGTALLGGMATLGSGIAPTSNTVGYVFGAADKRISMYANNIETSTQINPISNTVGAALGAPTARYTLFANGIQTSGNITPISNTVGCVLGDLSARYTLHANSITASSTVYPTANGGFLGLTTQRWAAYLTLADVTGNITVGGDVFATGSVYSAYSDVRLKTDVRPITDALTKVKSLRGIQYSPNERAEELKIGKQNERKVGLIAQDVQKVLPELVSLAPFDRDENGKSLSGNDYLSIQYDRTVALLVEAIKELSAEIEELRNGILHRGH